MPDGNLRRPPQLWEQKLKRLTSVLGVGIAGGGPTAVVDPQPPPGQGGGTEPAPVLPPPGRFIKPSTPALLGSVQGINVLWDGLNSESELWPYDTSWVEVHMDTSGTAFTPGTATLKGRFARPGSMFVGGLMAGTTYYFRLRGVDPAGNYTDPSDAASGQTGLTTSSDYGTATIGTGSVSFNARTIGGVTNTVGSTAPTSPLQGDVWLDSSPGTAIIHKVYNGGSWTTNAWGSASIAAGQITALQIAAGAVTAGAIAAGAVTTDKLTAGTITGFRINGGTISGGYISGGTISAGYISGGTINGATITSTSVSGYATTTDIANFITSSEVNGNVTSISGGVITSGTIIGRTVMSASSGKRIVLNSSLNQIDFYNSSGTKTADMGPATIGGVNGLAVTGAFDASNNISGSGGLNITGSAVDMDGVYNNNTTGIDSVGISATARLRRISSTQAIKYDISALSGDLSPAVDVARLSTVQTVDPANVLNVAVTEFSVIDDGLPTDRRVLGFIADDVADKFPIAATHDAAGVPAGVLDTAMIAALLAVVQDQQATIQDLRTRIEALEA